MPTKKKTSSTKKTTKSEKKKTTRAKKSSTPKKKSSSTAKKTKVAKKKTTKKAAPKKSKKPVAKKKSTAKKIPVKKTTVNKSADKVSDDGLFVMTMNEQEEKNNLHVYPSSRTLIQQLPVVDFDHMQHEKELAVHKDSEKEFVSVAVRSRVAFYLGIFLGAIVVNVFLVTILAVMAG